MPTGIWSSRWRSGCAHWDLDCEEEAAGEEVEVEAEEAEAEEEEENSSDKIQQPSPGRWGTSTLKIWGSERGLSNWKGGHTIIFRLATPT